MANKKDKDRFCYRSVRIPIPLDNLTISARKKKGQFQGRSFNYLATEGIKLICSKILGK